MDLVDIDKVLDELELNDDGSCQQPQRKISYGEVNRQELQQVQGENKDGSQHANEDKVNESLLARYNTREQQNNNVNVSNVFTSLNDYVSAEINNDSTDSSSISSSSLQSSPHCTSSEDSSDPEDEKITSKESFSMGEYLLDSSSVMTTIATNEVPPSDLKKQEMEDDNHDISHSLFSDTLSNDVVNLEGISSLSVDVNMMTSEIVVPHQSNVKEEIGDRHLAIQEETIPKEEEIVKKVVGFESTMDDVSDTELESYLQELEYETHNQNQILEEPIPEVVKEEEIPKIESLDQPPLLLSEDEESSIEIEQQQIRVEDEEKDEDLLSQASTLEFNDLVASTNAAGAVILENETPTITKEVDDIKFIDSTETESKIVDEPKIEPRLTRPNSLDVPSSSDGLHNNHHDSPGHTPPPIDSDPCLTLTSTSSDEFVPSMAINSPSVVLPVDEPTMAASSSGMPNNQLGRIPPFWVPDSTTNFCMKCNIKFSLLKRRHHCRSCGLLLCSTCCCSKAKLEYLGDVEARVCVDCDAVLNRPGSQIQIVENLPGGGTITRPNPNNPMEYCSMIPPLQQVASAQQAQSPISVMVPVGVLKKGTSKTARKEKNVMFSDGIRPGCDLTDLDEWDNGQVKSSPKRRTRVQTPITDGSNSSHIEQKSSKLPPVNAENHSYIPTKDQELPPIVVEVNKTESKYVEVKNDSDLMNRLRTETLKFAVQRNFHIFAKVIELCCCINRTVINFTTHGLHFVGQDEIVILLEVDDSNHIPKDIFLYLNDLYNEADKGNTVTELDFCAPTMPMFLGKAEHGGFLFVRQTYQCLQGVLMPESPFLIGILIHRWEVPWARILPLRLMLRLGALYRYYPSPHISVRGRESVYVEIAQTIVNLLADFRTYSYTLPTIRGMFIHIEDRKTSILIPRNRFEQVNKALNKANDHILAFGGNFSKLADGHLVCIQNTESGCPEANQYSTQAINIEGQPRKVTGATFIVLNGGLKTASGLTGKCSIVEDGLMVQIPAVKMTAVKEALKNMKNIDIVCGPVNAEEAQTEIVSIQWTENDKSFNLGVKSTIDSRSMDGVPSIRVHRGLDFCNSNHIIRWTEVYIIQGDEESVRARDAIDMSKLSEQIAKSTCHALVSFLDLLAANGLHKIGVRVTLDPENVCYEAGSKNAKLAPLYMKALDNELVAVLHRQASNLLIDQQIILELVFHLLDK